MRVLAIAPGGAGEIEREGGRGRAIGGISFDSKAFFGGWGGGEASSLQGKREREKASLSPLFWLKRGPEKEEEEEEDR